MQQTIDRDQVVAIQTPQAFQTTLLQTAYQHYEASDTDDAMLLERLGHRIHVVPGDRQTMKLTYPDDRVMIQAYLTDPENS